MQNDIDDETKQSYLKAVEAMASGSSLTTDSQEVLELDKYLNKKIDEIEEAAILKRDNQTIEEIADVRNAISKMLMILADNNTTVIE